MTTERPTAASTRPSEAERDARAGHARAGVPRRRPRDVPRAASGPSWPRDPTSRSSARPATVDEAVAGDRRDRARTSCCSTCTCPTAAAPSVLREVRAALPDVRFLALSVSDAAEDVIAVIRAGARGYVTKTISGRELAAAIRRVPSGDAVFSPRLAGFVLDAFRRHRRGRRRSTPSSTGSRPASARCCG